jgi:hypothetical protein
MSQQRMQAFHTLGHPTSAYAVKLRYGIAAGERGSGIEIRLVRARIGRRQLWLGS